LAPRESYLNLGEGDPAVSGTSPQPLWTCERNLPRRGPGDVRPRSRVWIDVLSDCDRLRRLDIMGVRSEVLLSRKADNHRSTAPPRDSIAGQLHKKWGGRDGLTREGCIRAKVPWQWYHKNHNAPRRCQESKR